MQDLLTDETGDLGIQGGDLLLGFSDLQHQEHLLVAQKGMYKQFPDVGVGIENFLKDSGIDEMLTEIRAEFIKDGMTVTKLNYNEQTGNLDYAANY